eukprot:TRINITY_DN36900_c0_g1_i6.p1 TRINITY_DN36900_c0_g1~~TRINITY_DN36900_c0_g1_i6.p1  ORF type:complete len:568 (-),score=36.54 TRINITY_DN36900_c0_g1_i6:76-1779(-)
MYTIFTFSFLKFMLQNIFYFLFMQLGDIWFVSNNTPFSDFSMSKVSTFANIRLSRGFGDLLGFRFGVVRDRPSKCKRELIALASADAEAGKQLPPPGAVVDKEGNYIAGSKVDGYAISPQNLCRLFSKFGMTYDIATSIKTGDDLIKWFSINDVPSRWITESSVFLDEGVTVDDAPCSFSEDYLKIIGDLESILIDALGDGFTGINYIKYGDRAPTRSVSFRDENDKPRFKSVKTSTLTRFHYGVKGGTDITFSQFLIIWMAKLSPETYNLDAITLDEYGEIDSDKYCQFVTVAQEIIFNYELTLKGALASNVVDTVRTAYSLFSRKVTSSNDDDVIEAWNTVTAMNTLGPPTFSMLLGSDSVFVSEKLKLTNDEISKLIVDDAEQRAAEIVLDEKLALTGRLPSHIEARKAAGQEGFPTWIKDKLVPGTAGPGLRVRTLKGALASNVVDTVRTAYSLFSRKVTSSNDDDVIEAWNTVTAMNTLGPPTFSMLLGSDSVFVSEKLKLTNDEISKLIVDDAEQRAAEIVLDEKLALTGRLPSHIEARKAAGQEGFPTWIKDKLCQDTPT